MSPVSKRLRPAIWLLIYLFVYFYIRSVVTKGGMANARTAGRVSPFHLQGLTTARLDERPAGSNPHAQSAFIMGERREFSWIDYLLNGNSVGVEYSYC